MKKDEVIKKQKQRIDELQIALIDIKNLVVIPSARTQHFSQICTINDIAEKVLNEDVEGEYFKMIRRKNEYISVIEANNSELRKISKALVDNHDRNKAVLMWKDFNRLNSEGVI